MYIYFGVKMLTLVHSSQHACDELVDPVTLLNEWHERRDFTFVIIPSSEMRENKLLKGVYLIL